MMRSTQRLLDSRPLAVVDSVGLLAAVVFVFGRDQLRRQHEATTERVTHTLEALSQAARFDGDLVRVVGEGQELILNTNAQDIGHLDVATRRVTADFPVQRNRGLWIWVEAAVRLVRAPKINGPLSRVTAQRDISERHTQAAEMSATNAILEKLPWHLVRAREHAAQATQVLAAWMAGCFLQFRTENNADAP